MNSVTTRVRSRSSFPLVEDCASRTNRLHRQYALILFNQKRWCTNRTPRGDAFLVLQNCSSRARRSNINDAYAVLYNTTTGTTGQLDGSALSIFEFRIWRANRRSWRHAVLSDQNCSRWALRSFGWYASLSREDETICTARCCSRDTLLAVELSARRTSLLLVNYTILSVQDASIGTRWWCAWNTRCSVESEVRIAGKSICGKHNYYHLRLFGLSTMVSLKLACILWIYVEQVIRALPNNQIHSL